MLSSYRKNYTEDLKMLLAKKFSVSLNLSVGRLNLSVLLEKIRLVPIYPQCGFHILELKAFDILYLSTSLIAPIFQYSPKDTFIKRLLDLTSWTTRTILLRFVFKYFDWNWVLSLDVRKQWNDIKKFKQNIHA